MKKIKLVAISLVTIFGMQFLVSCFGKFALIRKVYQFHDGIMGNDLLGRFVKSVLLIIPGELVYGICGFVDMVVLNLIEFWTGSNPMAMIPGEKETQFVTHKGKTYKMTAEYGKMTIVDMTSEKETTLFFNASTSSVTVLKDGQMVKVGDFKVENRDFASAREVSPATF